MFWPTKTTETLDIQIFTIWEKAFVHRLVGDVPFTTTLFSGFYSMLRERQQANLTTKIDIDVAIVAPEGNERKSICSKIGFWHHSFF